MDYEKIVRVASKQHIAGLKDIKSISKQYDVCVDEFYNSLIKDASNFVSEIKQRQKNEKKKASDLFKTFKSNPTTGNKYDILNKILGPNELRRDEWQYRFSVKSQDKKLEWLKQDFEDVAKGLIG